MIKESSYDDLIDIFGTQPVYAASIKVSRRCNLACKHCYVNTDRTKKYNDEFSTEKIFSLIDELKEMGVSTLFLNGGEPLIHKDILDIYDYATQKGFKISMSTNGFNVGRDLIQKISTYNPELFQVSIDGIGDTHDKIRNMKGAFEKSINTLREAVSIFKNTETNVVMATVVMKDNIDEIEKLYEMAWKMGVNTFAVIPLSYTGKATNDLDVSIKEKSELFNKLSELYNKKYKSTELSLVLPPALIPQGVQKGKFGAGYLCTFPHMMGINSDGSVAMCDGLLNVSEMILGNANNQKLSDIWENDLVEEVIKENCGKLKGVCSICKYIDKCRGGCRASSYFKYKDFSHGEPICQEFYDNDLFPVNSLKGRLS